MQTLKPLSAINSYDPDDFPALLESITANEVSGNTFISAVSGATYTGIATTLAVNADGSFIKTGGSSYTASVSPGAVGTKDPVLIAVCTMADAEAVVFGNIATGPGLGISTIGSTVVRVTSNLHTTPNLTKAGLTQGCYILGIDNSANSGILAACDSVATVFEAGVTSSVLNTLQGTWAAFTTGNVLQFPAAKSIWGIYMLAFTDRPSASEMKSAAGWMSANPTLGLWPGWKGVA